MDGGERIHRAALENQVEPAEKSGGLQADHLACTHKRFFPFNQYLSCCHGHTT
jgi:hypothetical protein